MKRKSIAGRIILFVTALLLIGVLVVGSVCISLALRDNIKEKYTMTETDDGFLFTVLKGAVFGKAFEVSDVQVNTYMNDKFCGADKPLKNIRVYFHNNESDEFFAKIHYFNHDLAFQGKVDYTLDKSEGVIAASLKDVKIGELSIDGIILNALLSGLAEKTDNVQLKDGLLYIRTRYLYELGDLSLTLRLEELESGDGMITCRTNSLTLEVLGAVKDYIFSEKGKELFQRIFS